MLMNTHSLLTLATQVAETTGTAFVVFEAANNGGSQNWSNHFPSLVAGQLVMVASMDGHAAMHYTDYESAAAAFSTFAREATENYTAIIEGEIHIVGPLVDDPRTFDIASTTYPVYENGKWRDEIAPNRL